MKKHYKVIDAQTYRSCAIIAINCKYALNQTTKPQLSGSKLFVFNSLENARKFADDRVYDSIIFECVVTKPCEPIPYKPIKYWLDSIKDYWNAYNAAKQQATKNKKAFRKYFKTMYLCGTHWPEGTVWCDSVTLTKRIY